MRCGLLPRSPDVGCQPLQRPVSHPPPPGASVRAGVLQETEGGHKGRSGDLCSLLGGGFPHVLLILTRRSGPHGAHLRGMQCSISQPAGSCSTKKPPLAYKLVQSRVSTSCDAHPCSPPRLAVPPGRGAASRHVDRSGVEHAAALVPARGCVNEEDDEGGRWRACFMRRMRTRDVGLAVEVTSSLRGRLRFRTASGESDAVPN